MTLQKDITFPVGWRTPVTGFAFCWLSVVLSVQAPNDTKIQATGCQLAQDQVVCARMGGFPERKGRLVLDPGESPLDCSCGSKNAMVLTDRALRNVPLSPVGGKEKGEPISITDLGIHWDLRPDLGAGVAGWLFSEGCLFLATRKPFLMRLCPDDPSRDSARTVANLQIVQAQLARLRGLLFVLADGRQLLAIDFDHKSDLVSIAVPEAELPAKLDATGNGLSVQGQKSLFDVVVGSSGINAVTLVRHQQPNEANSTYEETH